MAMHFGGKTVDTGSFDNVGFQNVLLGHFKKCQCLSYYTVAM